MQRQRLGKQGEAMAKAFLEAAGYHIQHQNWRFGRLGEIDLVAYHPGQKRLAFVEVKARTNTRFGHAVEAITLQKQATMTQLAEIYLQQHPLPEGNISVSFDVVTMTPDEQGKARIDHYPDAF